MGCSKTDSAITISKNEIQFEREFKNDDNANISDEEILNSIFDKKVMAKECDIRNIQIDDEILESLKEKSQKESTESEKNKLKDIGMSEESFKENYLQELVCFEKEILLKQALLEEISSNNIKVEDKEFKSKIDNYNKKKSSYSIEENLLQTESLLHEYIDIIKSNYTIAV